MKRVRPAEYSATKGLNTIPASIIDHIEVLQDGASSIYGSDAIAGVINVITKKSSTESSSRVMRVDNEPGRRHF